MIYTYMYIYTHAITPEYKWKCSFSQKVPVTVSRVYCVPPSPPCLPSRGCNVLVSLVQMKVCEWVRWCSYIYLIFGSHFVHIHNVFLPPTNLCFLNCQRWTYSWFSTWRHFPQCHADISYLLFTLLASGLQQRLPFEQGLSPSGRGGASSRRRHQILFGATRGDARPVRVLGDHCFPCRCVAQCRGQWF